ncbi:MAG: helix-hairpin-helix domain-containing protein [Peptococcaceae bacterium]|nr:helix-hairpin-helix domain-containing protein [Peptococcaceae bacterium]
MMRRRNQIIWGVILGLVVIAGAVKIFMPGQAGMTFQAGGSGGTGDAGAGGPKIAVHVAGAVKNPGLVYLPLDARVSDALAEAGLLDEADRDKINLAQKLKDGQRIYIPYKGEAGEGEGEDGSGGGGGSSGDGTSSDGMSGGKVNINTANSSQLQRLPGVGPAIAERIIAYRTANGVFVSPEDLMNVSGIGQKTYEKLADQITVGP